MPRIGPAMVLCETSPKNIEINIISKCGRLRPHSTANVQIMELGLLQQWVFHNEYTTTVMYKGSNKVYESPVALTWIKILIIVQITKIQVQSENSCHQHAISSRWTEIKSELSSLITAELWSNFSSTSHLTLNTQIDWPCKQRYVCIQVC